MNIQEVLSERREQRREFMLAARRYGFTAAVIGLGGGFLTDRQAMAQTMADEEKKQKAAKQTMQFATEYKIEDYVKYPIMQGQYKANIEALSKGQIYCKLYPAGQLGAGSALAQKIQAGTVQGGSVSLSNFSPFAPVVDLINIPYWCGDNQSFANLVTSKTWNDEITPKVMAKGYKPLFYFTVDPRTIASRKGFKPIKTPSDMQGMKMRVPGSKLLQTFYRLAGANPTVVPWGETATAIKQGVADGLDPAISALATFGFQDLLSNISYIRSVPDAQMFAANAIWFQELSAEQRSAVDTANEKTQIE
ncbi:MAG: TRAP transporter substrate-binding protein, partial [Rhizobacter sp.]|nr:TRAP transporter substrate-binding protein [Rhizobacter sp.]